MTSFLAELVHFVENKCAVIVLFRFCCCQQTMALSSLMRQSIWYEYWERSHRWRTNTQKLRWSLGWCLRGMICSSKGYDHHWWVDIGLYRSRWDTRFFATESLSFVDSVLINFRNRIENAACLPNRSLFATAWPLLSSRSARKQRNRHLYEKEILSSKLLLNKAQSFRHAASKVTRGRTDRTTLSSYVEEEGVRSRRRLEQFSHACRWSCAATVNKGVWRITSFTRDGRCDRQGTCSA